VNNALKGELAALEVEQDAARTEAAAERAVVDGELALARERRVRSAEAVPAALRTKYDRIRGRKRVEAVFAMNGMSCGNCDTAIPLQRRHVMNNTGAIELCEACGVLMYYAG
jgi:predicted  nucleic acid-binding Zn-ribbon protein